MQVSGALALLDTNYPKVYLGFETIFGSPSTSLGTLPPGGVGWGADSLLRLVMGEYLFRYFGRPFY